MVDFTVVTGFFDIGRDNWEKYNRPVEHYLRNMGNFLKFRVNMIIFIQPEHVDFVNRIRKKITDYRTTIIPTNIEDLHMWRYLDQIKTIQSTPEYYSIHPNNSSPEICQPLYNIVVCSKMDLLYRATQIDNISEYFIWLDAGFSHNIHNFENRTWNPTTLFQHREHISFLCLRSLDLAYDNPVDFFKQYEDFVTGGFIGGYRDVVATVRDEYYKLVDSIITSFHLIDDDQFFNTMFCKHCINNPANLIFKGWFGILEID